LLERALGAELSEHLGYEKHDPAGYNTGNSRNGTTPKTVKGDFGEMVVETPRDRNGSFEPQILQKHQTRFDGFDEKILSLYARGMTTREIQGHLQQMYGVEVSPTLISTVTDAVLEEVKAWQNRPLEPIYGLVFLDALYVKMRHEGRVENRAVYVAIGVDLEGCKEVLGLWTSSNEGAKFWLGVLTELKNRGVKDVLIACIDGLKGFPQAIEAVFPETRIQLCIVHLVRASLQYVNWKERKRVAADLKSIYRASTERQAEQELTEFIAKWGGRYQAIGRLWKDHWQLVIPLFEFPAEVRRVMYTTNAVESLHMSLRKIIKTRGSFPSSSRLLQTARPSRSQYRIFTRSLRRLVNTNRCPARTSNSRWSRTSACRLSKLLRMSHGVRHKYTRTLAGRWIMPATRPARSARSRRPRRR
jgi:putative transposase